MASANKMFKYDQVIMNTTLNDIVEKIHKEISTLNNWSYKPLSKGMYGYDNLILSIGYILKYCPDKLNQECVAEYAHVGWAVNYKYWRDNKPWTSNKYYKNPGKELGDERRNRLAEINFNDLPDNDKETNLTIAKYLINMINPEKYKFKIIFE